MGGEAGAGARVVRCPSRTTRDNCFLIQLEGIREFSVPFRDNSRLEGDISPSAPFPLLCILMGKHSQLLAWLLRGEDKGGRS